MNFAQSFLLVFILLTGVLNLVRIFFYVLANSKYTLWSKGEGSKDIEFNISNRHLFPDILVVVPAYNEAKTISRTIESLNFVNYPKNKLRILVVNDGSKDATSAVVAGQIYYNGPMNFNFQLIDKPNGGKADALNCGIKSTDFGELITCLDADSTVDKNFFINMSKYFKYKSVVSAAANVQISHNNTLIGLLQMFEYLISYQMKKSQTYFNIEYIVGGIGSTFRRTAVEAVGYYDTNTMTEDIDLTVKIINKFGNKKAGIIYAHDAVAHSQPVGKFKELISQRFRWKFGRMQTLYKNKNMIMNFNKKYDRRLTIFAIPFAIFGELTLSIELLIYLSIIFYSLTIGGFGGLVYPIFLSLWYAWYNIWYSEFTPKKDKLLLSVSAPIMYFGMGFLMIVEFIALIKSLIRLPFIKKSISNDKVSWQSPSRN